MGTLLGVSPFFMPRARKDRPGVSQGGLGDTGISTPPEGGGGVQPRLQEQEESESISTETCILAEPRVI